MKPWGMAMALIPMAKTTAPAVRRIRFQATEKTIAFFFVDIF
jgi:hypothetical protein